MFFLLVVFTKRCLIKIVNLKVNPFENNFNIANRFFYRILHFSRLRTIIQVIHALNLLLIISIKCITFFEPLIDNS